MAPQEAQLAGSPARKKQRLAENRDAMMDTADDRIGAIDFGTTPFNEDIGKELFTILKPGMGLIGDDSEEAMFYEKVFDGEDAGKTHGTEQGIDEAEAQAEDGGDEEAAIKYKAPKDKRHDDEASEDLGHYENRTVGNDYIPDENNISVHVGEYFGAAWSSHINQLYAVPPMETPPFITVRPHDYQLKAAAQAHWSCRTKFRGFLLGDGMGVGKTITAILALWLAKDLPGFSLIVVPKSLVQQWVETIRGLFQEGHGLTVYILEGSSSINAHQLMALGVDVVVTSYEQVEACGRARRMLPGQLDRFVYDDKGEYKQPTRPNGVLHTTFWRDVGYPIKRLVLDEAQVVNKRDGIRHQALKNLDYDAVIQLSGSFAYNKWHNFSGHVDFLEGHGLRTHGHFMRAFSSGDEGGSERPNLCHIRLVQRFLQAFTIARPSTILQLEACVRLRSSFKLDSIVSSEIDEMMEKFNRKNSKSVSASDSDDTTEMNRRMRIAVQAQMMSMHPLLVSAGGNDDDIDNKAAKDFEQTAGRGDAEDEDETGAVLGNEIADEGAETGQARTDWLQGLKKINDLYSEAPRLRRLMAIYRTLRKKHPERKMVVFSLYLRFLDIFAEVLKRDHQVEALRYDGTVNPSRRPAIQQEFETASPQIPLLLTAGAGGFGLNITCATVMIQTEIWWNPNLELQAICRIWRQKQTEEVLAIQLWAENSAVDSQILAAQERKSAVIDVVMDAIVRRPGEGPALLDLHILPVFAPMRFEEFSEPKVLSEQAKGSSALPPADVEDGREAGLLGATAIPSAGAKNDGEEGLFGATAIPSTAAEDDGEEGLFGATELPSTAAEDDGEEGLFGATALPLAGAEDEMDDAFANSLLGEIPAGELFEAMDFEA